MTLFLIVFFYFLPTLVALRKPQAGPVFVIDLFLGWTFIGWVIALAMAVAKPRCEPIRHDDDADEAGESAPQAPGRHGDRLAGHHPVHLAAGPR